MTPEKQQIKSSMQFLGRIHENYVKALNAHFNADKHNYLALNLNNKLISTILSNQNSVFYLIELILTLKPILIF